MSSNDSDTVDVTVSCLCGEHKHTYALPSSTDVLEYYICHCNSCRKSAGASLYQGCIVWPYPLKTVSEREEVPEDPKILLKHYAFGSTLDFWFCATCSTKMYWQYKRPGSHLELFPGLAPDHLVHGGDLQYQCKVQVHVGDTLDEGFSRCFFRSDGDIGERRQGGTSTPLFVPEKRQPIIPVDTTTVDGEYHCGQVSLKLTRDGSQKYPVELDTRLESRLFNSVDVSTWALASRQSVYSINNMPFHILEALMETAKDGYTGSISVYKLTSGKTIFFCNVCSATIIEQTENSSLLKIGAGLLKSTTGSRAEDILDWSNVGTIDMKSRNIRIDTSRFETID